MSQASIPLDPHHTEIEASLLRGKVGMICLFIAEAHIFGVLIVAFLVYLDQIRALDPPPREMLSLPLAVLGTAVLLSSSYTVHQADGSFRRGHVDAYRRWWLVTIALGITFLIITGIEWRGLIEEHGLSLSQNMFGTCYFSLVGFHAFHVTVGVVAMSIVLGMVAHDYVTPGRPAGVELIAWYWHFVDGVWVVVFCVVYLLSR